MVLEPAIASSGGAASPTRRGLKLSLLIYGLPAFLPGGAASPTRRGLKLLTVCRTCPRYARRHRFPDEKGIETESRRPSVNVTLGHWRRRFPDEKGIETYR